jgi:hypothetical protein
MNGECKPPCSGMDCSTHPSSGVLRSLVKARDALLSGSVRSYWLYIDLPEDLLLTSCPMYAWVGWWTLGRRSVDAGCRFDGEAAAMLRFMHRYTVTPIMFPRPQNNDNFDDEGFKACRSRWEIA